MKALIITVAGTSTRFNQSVGGEWLKCLYFERDNKNCLLYRILERVKDFEQIIIVGGYKYEALVVYVESLCDERIKLVYNEHFVDYGSGYSLYLGLKALDAGVDEITFVEGDLYFDTESFEQIQHADGSVLCVNHELILANKAVVLYFDTQHHPHYIYDTTHKALQIDEPFEAIYNSGQMWRFSDAALMREVIAGLSDKEQQGTNLIIIQKYLDNYDGELTIVPVETWYNCNTITDYRNVLKQLNQ